MSSITAEKQAVSSRSAGCFGALCKIAQGASATCNRVYLLFNRAVKESSLTKEVGKAIGSASFWVKYFYPAAPAGVTAIGAVGNGAKCVISALETPSKVEALASSGRSFVAKPSIEGAVQVVYDTSSVVTRVADGITLVNPAVGLAPDAMKTIGFVSSGASFVVSAKDGVDDARKLAMSIQCIQCANKQDVEQVREEEIPKISLRVMTLAKNIACVAIAILAIAAVVTGFVAAPWIPAALASAAIFLTITAYFYERIRNPENKPEFKALFAKA